MTFFSHNYEKLRVLLLEKKIDSYNPALSFSILLTITLSWSRTGCGGGRVPANIAGLRIQKNIKLNGADYQNITVNNVQECARDSHCRSFNYGKERRDCWLKNNIPKACQIIP